MIGRSDVSKSEEDEVLKLDIIGEWRVPKLPTIGDGNEVEG